MGAKEPHGQARRAARCGVIGQAPERSREALLPHRRPRSFARWLRSGPLVVRGTTAQPAPDQRAKERRSNGSLLSRSGISRHSPYTIQIRGNRTTFPPQGNCIPYAAIRWHDFGNRPALGRPLGHFSRHPDTPLLSLSPRRRFPRPTPERVFVADHQSSSGFSGTGPSAPPPQPIGT